MNPSKSDFKVYRKQLKRLLSAKSSVSGSRKSAPKVKVAKRPHSEERQLTGQKKRKLVRENQWPKIWKVTDDKSKYKPHQHGNSHHKTVITESKPSNGQPAPNSHNQQTVTEQNYKEEYIKRLECLEKYGKNFYCPAVKQRSGLRPVYIDGSNVAFSHGQKERFSVEGLKICLDYFIKRGHEARAFVPNFRLRKGESTNQKLLHSLVRQKLVITTPTLFINNQLRSPYDDWYIVQSAAANGGIIVSADNFQDIVNWNPNLRPVVEERRLVPTFVDDMIIFPVDPHGNRKNNLEQFLRF